MAVTQITRGSSVVLVVTFKDEDDAAITGLTPEVTLTYLTAPRTVAAETKAMTALGSNYVATWESVVAIPCLVEYSANSGGGIVVVVDGNFELTANTANIAAG